MAFQNIDWEALLQKDSELPTDVTFKVYDNDSVLVQDGDSEKIKTDTFKIFRAHKFMLAAVSPMFRRQFFGLLPETKQPVWVERTSSKAFGIMLRFLYQKDGQFAFSCGHFDFEHFACLFEVKNLGEKYQIADLVQKTDFEISNRQLTHENLIEAVKSAKSFRQIFPDISDRLMGRCGSFFTSNYKTLETIRMLLNDHDDSQIDTDIIVTLIKAKPITQRRKLGERCARCYGEHTTPECTLHPEELYCRYPPCANKVGHVAAVCHELTKVCILPVCKGARGHRSFCHETIPVEGGEPYGYTEEGARRLREDFSRFQHLLTEEDLQEVAIMDRERGRQEGVVGSGQTRGGGIVWRGRGRARLSGRGRCGGPYGR